MPTVLHSGCHLSYRISGDGPPVIFIQGVGIHGCGWNPQTDELSSLFRCLSFDNGGIGLSQPAAGPMSVEVMARDTLALMDAEGWHSAHVVGHSLGGLIAQYLALTRRERVRSLSLLCTFADGRVPVRMSGRMIWVGSRTRIGTRRMRRTAFLELVLPRVMREGADRTALAVEVARVIGHDLADQPPIAMRQLSAMRAYDATPQLGELRGMPTLVISASEDIIAPAWAGRKLAEGIPGARFVEIPDAAHGLPMHAPAKVNGLLIKHLQKSEQGSRT